MSEHLPNRVLILLSGESSTIPAAEAQALLRTYDPKTVIERSESRVLMALTNADPDLIARRIAYARRVGLLISGGRLSRELKEKVKHSSFRLRRFTLAAPQPHIEQVEEKLLGQLDGRVDLDDPDYEFSVIVGRRVYLALTDPRKLNQDWVSRRPRRRAFFHPTAIFPKLSRALVNLSGVRQNEILLDPFAGTGSIMLEAFAVGVLPVALDISRVMVRGALANQRGYAQSWLGIIQADSNQLPIRKVHGIVTDIPYGRASSAYGKKTSEIVGNLLDSAAKLLDTGRLMVIMHPDSVRIVNTENFTKEGSHYLYIHRKLTRVITVLRRT